MMLGSVKKLLYAFLAFFLVSCIGVGILAPTSPAMAPWFLACVGALFFACVGVAASFSKLRERRRLKKMGSAPGAPPLRPALAQVYASALAELEIPPSAGLLHMTTRLLSPDITNIPHYVWLTETALCFFPHWEGIDANLKLLEYLHRDAPSLTDKLEALRVPLDSILYYIQFTPVRGEEGYTVLRYRGALEDEVGLLLHEDAYPALKVRLPDLDLSIMQQQQYPGSAQQIMDIAGKMRQLKELRMQSLIDEKEYTAKKAEILMLL